MRQLPRLRPAPTPFACERFEQTYLLTKEAIARPRRALAVAAERRYGSVPDGKAAATPLGRRDSENRRHARDGTVGGRLVKDDRNLEPDGISDDTKPVAADIPVGAHAPKRPTNRPTKGGRIFGGVLAFLSLWEVLNPEDATGTLLGLVGLVVSALWFVPCPKYFRLLATAALFAWILVLLRAAPAYVPRHGRRNGAAGALHDG